MNEKNFRMPARIWPKYGSLFPPLNDSVCHLLDQLLTVLEEVWPLSPAHKKSLPEDIRELSLILTRDRSALRKPYWMRPAFISAYLYYFLPWNIIRLARLFHGMTIPEPDWTKVPILIDMGAGPFTLPLALLFTRQTWHDKPLTILAVDTAKQPLELGVKIFKTCSRLIAANKWSITSLDAPINGFTTKIMKKVHALNANPWLLTAANVLNEIRYKNSRASEEESEDTKFDQLLGNWDSLWQNQYFRGMLFIEPGTRLGGTTLMELRACALSQGLKAIAPCTHDNPCPLLENNARGHKSGLASRWCHFTFKTQGVPQWLERLSDAAGLSKNTLSLSLLYLRDVKRKSEFKDIPVRILSQPFDVPGIGASCRYGCASCGLCILPMSQNLPSGALTAGKLPEPKLKDKRSGALVMENK